MDTPIDAARPAMDEDITDDLIVGAKAIAAFLGSEITERQVYQMAEAGAVPIHKTPGLGLTACKSTLNRFFRGRDAAFLDDLDAPPPSA